MQQLSSQQGRKPTIRDYIKSMEGEIAKALPSVMTPERFTRIALSAVSATPKLAECTPGSFLGALMAAAQLGLEPNTPLGQAYLIPYKNKNVMQCQFQIGYKGLIDLAYRSGDVATVQAHAVYENDFFEYEFGLEPYIRHKPAAGERGKPVAYYGMFRLTNGGSSFKVMSKAEVIERARKYSRSYDKGPWTSEFDEMAKKTVLKAVLKYAPLKSDFAAAAAADGGTFTVDSETGEILSGAILADYEISEPEAAPSAAPSAAPDNAV